MSNYRIVPTIYAYCYHIEVEVPRMFGRGTKWERTGPFRPMPGGLRWYEPLSLHGAKDIIDQWNRGPIYYPGEAS